MFNFVVEYNVCANSRALTSVVLLIFPRRARAYESRSHTARIKCKQRERVCRGGGTTFIFIRALTAAAAARGSGHNQYFPYSAAGVVLSAVLFNNKISSLPLRNNIIL